MSTFGIRLLRARLGAGLSLRGTAALIGLSHAAIKKYEDGLVYPSSDVLLKLAKAFHVRVEYFFRPEAAQVGEIKFRKRQLQKKVLDAIKHEITDQIERRFELENLIPNKAPSFKRPKVTPEHIDVLDQVEAVADHLRHSWKLGMSPLHDLVDVLETRGIKVFMVKHESKDFDGLSGVVNDVPIIVVGAHWPGDRQRFTLAHELGHLILRGHLSSTLDEELTCNRFAGAFLLPRSNVIQEVGAQRKSVELRELVLLKEEYGISMGAICYRLRELSIVTESFFNDLMKLFKKRGWNKREPGEQIASERAHVFEQMVFHALGEDYIGESKAAELLGLSVDQLRALRVVENHIVAD